MPVGSVFGRAPDAMRPFLRTAMDPARFWYFGIQVGDDGDWGLQREFQLGTLTADTLLGGPVHIHFDLDVLDPAEFPYLAYTDGKLGIDDAVALVRRVADQSDLVGLTLTEFSPADDEDARDGSKVIARLCEAAMVTREMS
jgi:arginase